MRAMLEKPAPLPLCAPLLPLPLPLPDLPCFSFSCMSCRSPSLRLCTLASQLNSAHEGCTRERRTVARVLVVVWC